jgi:hypothetical protein
MTTLIALFVGVVPLLWFSRWVHRDEELGSVSAQWLSEYRQNHES